MAFVFSSLRRSRPLSDVEVLRQSVRSGLEVPFFDALSKIDDDDDLDIIVNEKYKNDDDEEVTILLEATKFGHLNIVKHLLKYCNINVNATGNVEHSDLLYEGATALWLAAVSGHLEIVKVLINYGATIDYCTNKNSTPLRAACYLGHLDVIKYLIKHGANVNFTNISKNTCLMLSSSKGFEDVVKYLLKNGADVNEQCHCGATAMHYAAIANNVNIVKSLLKFNAQQLKDEQSLTPIMVAAEKAHYAVTEYLLSVLNLTREEIIEVKELLGASLLNHEDSLDLGFSFLLQSMEMRYNEYPVIPKKVYKIVEAYGYQSECQNIEDLMNIKNNIIALHYESLIIRERILGDTSLDLVPFIINRANAYAFSRDFTSCLKLSFHSMHIAQKNQLSVDKFTIHFLTIFKQIINSDTCIKLSDLKTMLIKIVEDVQIKKKKMLDDNSVDANEKKKSEFLQSYVNEILAFVILTSYVLAQGYNSNDAIVEDIMKIIGELIELDVRTSFNQTLLHLCVDYTMDLSHIFNVDFCVFPNFLSMKLLIFCGANVNAVDEKNNTPLHYIGKFIVNNPHLPHNNCDDFDTKNIVMELINAGAHADFVNDDGECPHTGYLKTLFNLTNKTPLSLQCLSAKTMKYQCPKESYQNKLPRILKDFTSSH